MDLEKFIESLKKEDGFECEKCGKCCHGTQLEITPEDFTKLEDNKIDISLIEVGRFEDETVHKATIMFTNEGECPYWDATTKLCIIHPNEPMICKIFPYCIERYIPRDDYNSEYTYYRIIRKPCLKEREKVDYYWKVREFLIGNLDEDYF
jgi:Fe-S-cluster containining protein